MYTTFPATAGDSVPPWFAVQIGSQTRGVPVHPADPFALKTRSRSDATNTFPPATTGELPAPSSGSAADHVSVRLATLPTASVVSDGLLPERDAS